MFMFYSRSSKSNLMLEKRYLVTYLSTLDQNKRNFRDSDPAVT